MKNTDICVIIFMDTSPLCLFWINYIIQFFGEISK